jgi:hypothetical protein
VNETVCEKDKISVGFISCANINCEVLEFCVGIFPTLHGDPSPFAIPKRAVFELVISVQLLTTDDELVGPVVKYAQLFDV